MSKKCAQELVRLRKQRQNYIATIIILVGALCGSFFVDVTQMIRGKGFSDRAVRTTSIISYDGRTWVAYAEPIVPLTVVADTSCEDCDIDALLAWLQYAVPTIRPRVVDYSSQEGAALVERYGLTYVPSILFGNTITRTHFFDGAQDLFAKRDGVYVFDLPLLDIVPLKYIHAPRDTHLITIRESGAPKVTVTIVSDFSCKACKEIYATVRAYEKKYKDMRVLFAYVPTGHDDERGKHATYAVYCAQQQEKAESYIAYLFATRHLWRNRNDDVMFIRAARTVGIKDVTAFKQCMESDNIHARYDAMVHDVHVLGSVDVPMVFVNDHAVDENAKLDDILRDALK